MKTVWSAVGKATLRRFVELAKRRGRWPFPTVLSILLLGLPAFGSGAKELRHINLQSDFCRLQDQQFNSPPTGVDFLTEKELVVYTVCRTGVALSARDHFSPSDPNHLKALLLDSESGTVKRRFDWPTHGRGSFLRALHDGELLLHRDNVLQTFTPEGKPLHGVEIARTETGGEVLVHMSPAIDTVAAQEIALAPDGHGLLGTGTAVVDSRDLKVLARWPDTGDFLCLAASATSVVGSSHRGNRLDLHRLGDAQSITVWSQVDATAFRPVFLSDSEFASVIGGQVVLFDTTGAQIGKIGMANGMQIAVSRDGKVLAISWGRLSVDFATGSTTYLTAGADVYEVATLRRLASVTFPSTAFAGFDIALSPDGSRLAVADRMRVTTYAITDP